MKKSYTTNAINLKSYPLNDNDSVVVMFSKDKGLISAVAKGAKKPKSKLGARIQMFIANTLLLLEGKNLDTITEATSVNTFSKIRYDIDKLTYSMYISELVSTFCSKQYNQDENYDEIYNLIFKTYNAIANSSTKEQILLSSLKFQIKLMNILGWGLDFNYCANCRDEIADNAYFSNTHNNFLCEKCAKDDLSYNVKIHHKIKEFLSEISKNDVTKYDEIVNLTVLEKCFNFEKKYIDNISHKKTKIFETIGQMVRWVKF